MASFLSLLGRLSLPGMIYNNIEAIAKGKDSFLGNMLFNIFGEDGVNLSDMFQNYANSYINKATGAALTGAELENYEKQKEMIGFQADVQRDLRSSSWQDTISDMQKAGVNPAVAFGSGPTASSAPSGAGGSFGPSTLSDLIALATLPAQLGLIKAQTSKTYAEGDNLRERTRTQEQDTLLRSLMVEYYPSITDSQIQELSARVDNIYQDTRLKVAEQDKVVSDTTARDIENEYLSGRLAREIDKLTADIDNVQADTKLKIVRESMETIQRNFARNNGFLMSSNDTLMMCVYIGKLLGLTTESLSKFINEDVPTIVREVAENSHMYTPGGPHK